jgi:RNA-binding protein 26
VRQLCETEIPDFLKEDSTVFVRDVFEAIHFKSYVPGYIPPRRASATFAPPTGPSSSIPAYGNLGGMGPPVGAPMGPQNGARKRSYNERGDGDAHFQGGDINGRSFKQPRRGGRGGFDNFNTGAGRGGRQPQMNQPNMPQYPNMSGLDPNMAMGGMPSPPPGMPALDPNNPLSAILAMQALGLPVPNLPGFPQVSSSAGAGFSQPKKARCLDYDQKGFCGKGNTCQFEHGAHSIWVPPANRQDEYDPTNAGIVNNSRGGFKPFRGGDRGRGRGALHSGGQFSSPGRRGGRSEFSSDRPNHDKNNTTIVVENIPEEKFDKAEVETFFSEFGNVLDVDMRPYKRLAIVKYDDWNSAKAAYNSPKVIFDNRFVKVYWYVSQESLPQPPASAANGATKNGSVSSTTGPAAATEPEIDIEEFKQKQEEVQKAHEEKMKKTQEMEAQKRELEKRQEELLKRQAEEKRKLMEKLAAKKGTLLDKQEDKASTPAEPKSQTDILKAQLAALEAEAQSLGLPTDYSDDSSWASRGRGRGRGGYRGRAAYVPRGYRGGYRGRGGAPFVPGGRSFNLDNRPKKIGVTGIDFTNPQKDESLREYLLVRITSLYIIYGVTNVF